MNSKEGLRIVFYGTPGFAVASLKAIVQQGYRVVAVVTAPDKAAGRGQKLQFSEVKKVALELDLPVLQPINLKAEAFINELKSYEANLQIVIAFRMLPEIVWNMPELGTFNLHASYLPHLRGAAPINRAIMLGYKTTGITTFFLKHEIDTGSIILQKEMPILAEDNAGTLHDKLMADGAVLVVESLNLIANNKVVLQEQKKGAFDHAPKLFDQDCLIDWHQNAKIIYNQVRGLSPYPCAYTTFEGKKLKIYNAQLSELAAKTEGIIEILDKKTLAAHCADCVLFLTEVQLEGKKRMSAVDFINGHRNA